MLTLKPSFALFIGVLSVLMLGLFGGSVVKGQYSKVYSTYVGPPPANTGITIGAGGTVALGSPGANGTASVTNTGNINDADLTNFASLSAQSGANAGLLGTDGNPSSAYINLNFAGAITPINGTPIIIKLTATLPNLVTVQAYNNGIAVGASQAFSALSVSPTNEYVFLAPANCNSIRITSNTGVGSLLGGVSINNTNLFYAYIFDPTCNPPNYTATSKTQILDLGSGFVNQTNAIDGDITTFSKFSVGLGVGTTLYQDVYFSKLSNPGDAATITLAIPPAALSAGVLGYLNLNIYNGTTLVSNTSFGGLLLGTDLLTLLNAGLPITASIVPSGQFNRIQVSMSSLVGLATSLNLYEVQVTPPAPTFNPPVTLPAGFTLTICSGSSATITPDAPGAGNELRWYDAPAGGNLKFTGNSYVTGALTANLKLYVATAKSGCAAESERIPVTVIVNSVTAGTIGSDQTSCSGIAPTPFTSTSAATGAGTITYQWQKSTDNITFTDITGATNLTYSEAALLTQTTYYQRIATSTLNSVACTATSNKITATVNTVTAGTIGSNQTLCSSTVPAAFTNTAATGAGTITYQWQKSTDNITFSNIIGATNAAYSETAALTQTTYYQRIATSSLNSITCTATSNKITMTVNNITAGTIASDQTLCSGAVPTSFTNTAATGAGTITYQWQKSTDNITFSNITGATNAAYSETAALTQTTYYQRIATSTLNSVACTATSNKITITINAVTAGTIGSNQTLCSSTVPAAFTNTAATAAGTITYQWQKSTDNITFSNITGATNAAYSETAALTQTTYYQRVATSTLNAIACTATSNKITMTVNAVTAGTIGSDQTLCSNTVPAAFTNTAATGAGTITYQWQKSTDNITFSNITGATNAAYSETAALTQTTYYQRIATSSLNSVTCTATSNKITMTVNLPPTVSSIVGPSSLCPGTAYTFTNASTDPGVWSSDDPTIASVNSSTGFVTGIAVGSTLIKYKITNATTGCSNTASKSVTVYALPSISLGAIPAICLGTTTTSLPYTAVSSGSMKYDINWDTPGFVNVSSADLPTSPITLNIPANASAGNHTGTLIIKNTTTGCTFSQLITVSINPLPSITLNSPYNYCQGSTSTSLSYSAVTNAPTTYSITWIGAAITAGFTTITDAPLPAASISISVPASAPSATYTGTLTVKNANGCISNPVSISLVVNPKLTAPHLSISSN